jgi:hypothetical protein
MGWKKAMNLKFKYCALALAIGCTPASAFATGNLDCTIDDGNLGFTYEALFSYSGSSPILQAHASFQSRHPETSPHLKQLDESSLPRIQQWFEGKDLRLQFYAETEGVDVPFAAVKLTIETTVGEDGNSYSGTYRLEITPEVAAGKEIEAIRLEGPAVCSAG